jgi:hypothetical protein
MEIQMELKISDRPRTIEQFAALPVGPEYGVQRYEITDIDHKRGFIEVSGARCEVCDGVRFIDIPIAPEVVSFWSEPTDTLSWINKEGTWGLGRYADGRWFRERR